MAFGNIAGRAAFVLDLDKSRLDSGLPQAERQFQSATTSMARSTDRVTDSAGRASAAFGGRGGSALVGRMGLVGAAAYAGLNALQDLSKALKVTGYDAGTTEGKFRNFGAALAGGDVVGAIGALVHVTTLSTQAFADLQVQLYNMDFSTFNEQAAKAAGYVDQVNPTPFGRGRGAGLTHGPNTAMQEQLRLAQLAARDRRITDAASLAGRTPGLQDDLEAQRRRGQFIRDQLARATPGTDEYSRLSAELTAAINRRQDLENKIKGKKKPGSSGTAADRDKVAPAGIVDAGLSASLTAGLADDLKAATAEENYYRERLSHLKKGTERYTTVLGSLAQAHARRQSVVDQIDAANKSAAATAASKAKQAAADRKQASDEAARAAEAAAAEDARRLRAGLTLREGTLRNNLAAAELTEKNANDDKTALRRLIAFDRQQERNRKLTLLERQQFRTKEIQDRKALADLNKPDATKKAGAATAGIDYAAEQARFLSDMRKIVSNYGSNFQVHQTFHTQSDPDPSAMMRGAKYARFALRSSMEG